MNFVPQLSRVINSGQSRAVVLTGNVYDLFFDGTGYVPLVNHLSKSYEIKPNGKTNGITQLIYEVNNPIRIVGDESELNHIWTRFKGPDVPETIQELCDKSCDNPTLALEFLRWLTVCSRHAYNKGLSHNDMLVIVEAADMLIPEERIASMSFSDRRRVAILHDWFSDPEFMHGTDSVILISESRSLLHSRVSTLPQVISIEIPSPDMEERQQFKNWFETQKSIPTLPDNFIKNTAGLSLHALRQLLCREVITHSDVTDKVEEYITSQLGDDVVEFKKPSHKLSDVIGFTRLKKFIQEEMIPSIKADGDAALSGAAVGGPIGGGKTFICEAMASELDLPVLVLKNLRSQWYGQTDVIFERLKRTLAALDKVVIFVDEADTQFGGVGANTHETERRLTGKVQAMMSDPKLRGKVVWLLMTARINLLSPDIRRPGRVGDLIIPVLDPEGEDIDQFIRWTFKPEWLDGDNEINIPNLRELTKGYSAASFATLRSRIKTKKCQSLDEALSVINDMIPPDIDDTRTYQTLQAKVNCTRQSLLFDKPLTREQLESERKSWKEQIKNLSLKEV